MTSSPNSCVKFEYVPVVYESGSSTTTGGPRDVASGGVEAEHAVHHDQRLRIAEGDRRGIRWYARVRAAQGPQHHHRRRRTRVGALGGREQFVAELGREAVAADELERRTPRRCGLEQVAVLHRSERDVGDRRQRQERGEQFAQLLLGAVEGHAELRPGPASRA
jgi:hypothetical protein